MRVLLTTDTLGGVWTYTKELTEGLLQQGCSVALVTFGRLPSESQSAWCSRLEESAQGRFLYVASEIPVEWMADNEMIVEKGEELLRSLVRTFEPDLFHSNQFCFGQLSLGIPKLLVAHSDVLSWADVCVPEGLESSPWLSRYVDLVQSGLNGADWVVAPTSCMMFALKKNFSVSSPSTIVANGRTVAAPEGSFERVLQAVTAGRLWDRSKNVTAVTQIRDFPLMVAGESEDVPTAFLHPSNVHYLGFLPEPELHDLFRRSSLYIAASIYEPFGLAPLEAALCGCAIIANDIPSFREVWGSAAVYFKTPRELQTLLLTIADDRGYLANLQVQALDRARHYSSAAMTASYLSLYTKLLSNQSECYDHVLSLSTYVQ